MNNLEGYTANIGKIFSSDFFFRIPDSQRPFAWDEGHFIDLNSDITSAEEGQQYFLGTLVLHRKEDKSHYDVVDGQQRLTTLMILLACLRDRIEDEDIKKELQDKILQKRSKIDSIPEKPRLEVKDRAIFKELVLTENGTFSNKRISELPEPENRYLLAIKVFSDELDKLTQVDREKLCQFISQKCVIIYLSTSTFDDAFKLFTIVNDRGKQLRRIDVLKAQNIAPDVVSTSTIRDKIAHTWEELEKDLGENTFENILYQMRLIYLKEKPQEDLLKEFENKIFKKRLISKGEKFTDEVFSYGNLYRSIFIDKDVIPEADLRHNKFRSLVHIMDQEFEASEWRACLLYFTRKFQGSYLYEFLLAIEKVYLEQWVTGTRKDERFGAYAKILKLIETAKGADDVVKAMTYEEVKIVKALEAKNFYSLGYCKYFLLRLEILASEHDTLREFSAKSVEHVFPQKITVGSSWLSDPKIADHSTYVNTVGNLVLLSKGKNSSASNHDFAVKKEKYLKARVSDYPRSIQVLQEPNWTIQKIIDRNDQIKTDILKNP